MINDKTIKWILILLGVILIVNSMGIFNPSPIEEQNIITDLNNQCNLADMNSTEIIECATDVTINSIKELKLGTLIIGVLILIIGFVGFKKT